MDAQPRLVDIPSFEANPAGALVQAKSYAVWCCDASLCISVVWGRPTMAETRELTRLCEVAFSPKMAAPYATVIDVRGLEQVDRDAFGVLAEYVARRGLALGTRVRAQAVLRPDGFFGALAAGFLPVLGMPFDARVFKSPTEGLAWLGRDDAASLAANLEVVIASARAAGGLLVDLRDLLAQSPGKLTLAAAARKLAVSSRTLQRQLAESGTTFRTEVNSARVRAAQRLLAETNRNITAVALDVGCSSLQHLGTLFRRFAGQSPREWRERLSS